MAGKSQGGSARFVEALEPGQGVRAGPGSALPLSLGPWSSAGSPQNLELLRGATASAKGMAVGRWAEEGRRAAGLAALAGDGWACSPGLAREPSRIPGMAKARRRWAAGPGGGGWGGTSQKLGADPGAVGTGSRWGAGRGLRGRGGEEVGGARRLETGLLEGPPGHLAPALGSRTPRPCPFGRLLLLPFPQQALLQRTRASVPPTPLCPRSVAGSLAPRGCACPPRLETGLRGGAIGQQVRAPGWGAGAGAGAGAGGGGARPGLSQVAGRGSPGATKPRLVRGSLASKGASTTPRVLAPGAAQCPGPRHFQEKQCPTFGGVHPSIAQLVERRTVAWTRVDILRSLVRFRLEGGA